MDPCKQSYLGPQFFSVHPVRLCSQGLTSATLPQNRLRSVGEGETVGTSLATAQLIEMRWLGKPANFKGRR